MKPQMGAGAVASSCGLFDAVQRFQCTPLLPTRSPTIRRPGPDDGQSGRRERPTVSVATDAAGDHLHPGILEDRPQEIDTGLTRRPLEVAQTTGGPLRLVPADDKGVR